jgi:CHAT domain-containing protein
VAATLTALDGAGLAHLAGHGHHEPENVLFSRLDLADGPLMAYDVQRLAAVPRLITLSACDIGRAEYRTGDEQLGFTSALLYAGTSCVVAAVSRVRDETAVGVMTALHRALAGGAGPAAALAAASEKEPLATFVAFGAG